VLVLLRRAIVRAGRPLTTVPPAGMRPFGTRLGVPAMARILVVDFSGARIAASLPYQACLELLNTPFHRVQVRLSVGACALRVQP
jgi:hypothetical protein